MLTAPPRTWRRAPRRWWRRRNYGCNYREIGTVSLSKGIGLVLPGRDELCCLTTGFGRAVFPTSHCAPNFVPGMGVARREDNESHAGRRITQAVPHQGVPPVSPRNARA